MCLFLLKLKPVSDLSVIFSIFYLFAFLFSKSILLFHDFSWPSLKFHDFPDFHDLFEVLMNVCSNQYFKDAILHHDQMQVTILEQKLGNYIVYNMNMYTQVNVKHKTSCSTFQDRNHEYHWSQATRQQCVPVTLLGMMTECFHGLTYMLLCTLHSCTCRQLDIKQLDWQDASLKFSKLQINKLYQHIHESLYFLLLLSL